MNLDLTPEEAKLLADHLERHIARVDHELIHTDQRQMQREIHREEQQLSAILTRLRGLS